MTTRRPAMSGIGIAAAVAAILMLPCAPPASGQTADDDGRTKRVLYLLELVDQAQRYDDTELATKAYNEARQTDPILTLCRHDLATAGTFGLPLLAYDASVRPDLHDLEVPPAALEELDRMLAIAPDDAGLLRQRALFYAMIGEGELADDDLGAAVAASPDDPTLLTLRTLLFGSRATNALSQGDRSLLAEAIPAFEAAHARGFDHWLVHASFGYLLRAAQDEARACAQLQAAKEAVPAEMDDIRLAAAAAPLYQAVAACALPDDPERYDREFAEAWAYGNMIGERRQALCDGDR